MTILLLAMLMTNSILADDPRPISIERNIRYGEVEGIDPLRFSLDVYSPGVKPEKAPVMLYVHGGGWKWGDKKAVGRKPGYFTDAGWIFVSTNYRLLPQGKHPHNVDDIASALAWVHDHIEKRGGDPDKIFIMGHSAGCHLVSLVATSPKPLEKAGKSRKIIRGVIGLDCQAYDISELLQRQTTMKFYSGIFGSDPEGVRDASPQLHIKRGQGIAPFLICYSSGNTLRKNPWRRITAEVFRDALRAADIQADVVDASDRTHGQINQRFGDPADEKVTGKAMEFLRGILEKRATPAAQIPGCL